MKDTSLSSAASNTVATVSKASSVCPLCVPVRCMAKRDFSKLTELTAAENAKSTIHTYKWTAVTLFHSFISHDLLAYLTSPYSVRCVPANSHYVGPNLKVILYRSTSSQQDDLRKETQCTRACVKTKEVIIEILRLAASAALAVVPSPRHRPKSKTTQLDSHPIQCPS